MPTDLDEADIYIELIRTIVHEMDDESLHWRTYHSGQTFVNALVSRATTRHEAHLHILERTFTGLMKRFTCLPSFLVVMKSFLLLFIVGVVVTPVSMPCNLHMHESSSPPYPDAEASKESLT